jgi:hypothetical protein
MACQAAPEPEPEADPGGPNCFPLEQLELSDELGAREFSLLFDAADIPGLSAQPTEEGKRVGALFPYGGELHLGYGDYNANTGPIEMVAFDPGRHEWVTHGMVTTEDIQSFAVLDGRLFTANVDPTGHEATGSVFRLQPRCGQWEAMTAIPGSVHNYGLAVFEDRLLVTTGSLGGAAALVAATADGGKTWTTELSVDSSADDAYVRILHAGATAERLVVTGRHYGGPGGAFGHVYEEGSWVELQGLPSHDQFTPIAFSDRLVLAAFNGDVGRGGRHVGGFTIDGAMVEAVEAFPAGHELVNWSITPERYLWLLTENDGTYEILLSEDFEEWTSVADLSDLAGAEPTTLAFVGNAIYVGTSVGSLYVLDEVFVPVED